MQKKVLREEARDYFKQVARRSEQEASLSELSEEQLEWLYVLDEYPSDATLFDVQGYDVAIINEKLVDALSALLDDRRDYESSMKVVATNAGKKYKLPKDPRQKS